MTGEFVEETGDRGRNTVSQEGHQSLTSSDGNSEVPEPELRFVQYQASADREEIERSQLDPSIAEDLEEARRQFEAENTERESVEIAEEHEHVVPQGRVDLGRHHQTESDQESYEDDDMQEEEEENVNTRYWIAIVDKISDQTILQI